MVQKVDLLDMGPTPGQGIIHFAQVSTTPSWEGCFVFLISLSGPGEGDKRASS
jgi:hypothetical protein